MATATHPGAQTERRGGAGPVRACLAVRTPPAALLAEFVVQVTPVRASLCLALQLGEQLFEVVALTQRVELLVRCQVFDILVTLRDGLPQQIHGPVGVTGRRLAALGLCERLVRLGQGNTLRQPAGGVKGILYGVLVKPDQLLGRPGGGGVLAQPEPGLAQNLEIPMEKVSRPSGSRGFARRTAS